MQESVYSALFGALSNEHRLDLIANNLANVNTTGFKRDEIAFKDVFSHYAHDYILDSKPYLRAKPLWPEADVLAKPRLSSQRTNYSQGTLKLTGNALDVAIQGEGFFKVLTPDGVENYTRNGNFKLSPGGQLVTSQGYQVLGEGGPIELPPDGEIIIDGAGSISVGQEVVGRLQLVTFEDLRVLDKVGENLYRMGTQFFPQEEVPVLAGQVPPLGEGDGAPRTPTSVNQGYLEAANVEIVTEMVRMIETQRAFEAYNKIMQSTQTMDQKLTVAMGKPS